MQHAQRALLFWRTAFFDTIPDVETEQLSSLLNKIGCNCQNSMESFLCPGILAFLTQKGTVIMTKCEVWCTLLGFSY